MKHDKELAWLLDENWSPKVTHHTNHHQEGKEFDDQWARQYGYKDAEHMNSHNHKKDQECKARFGRYCERTKLW